MFETALDDMDNVSRFVKLLIDKEVMFEKKVYTDDSDVLDAMMLKHSGRFTVRDLQVLKDAFDAEKVEIGDGTISVYLPEALKEKR